MDERRFSLIHILVTVAVTVAATLAAVVLLLCLALGKWGVSVMEGIALVNSQFVAEFDGNQAADAAMSGIVGALGDRWSYYLNADQYEAQNDRRANSFVGIGVTVSYEREDGLLIQSVERGGPAEQGGLLPGELIVAVDGDPCAGDARYEAVDRIQGEEGTTVTLTVQSAGGGSREVTLTRARISRHSVEWTMLEDKTAVITVSNFYTDCGQQGEAAMADAAAAGAQRIVFDMRNNPGGYITELTYFLDAVLPEGVIFRTTGPHGFEREEKSDENCVELPMAVLVNADTYSAAEFFAAELQEEDWAIIVGTPTSGKGYSQITYPLLHGGAMAISTNTYRTGNGVSLIGTGLDLDLEVSLTEEQNALLASGALAPEEDGQLQAAIEALQAS